MAIADLPYLHPSVDAGITARVWRPGTAPAAIDVGAAAAADGVVHLEIAHGTDARVAHDALLPVCGPDLTLAMVEDLLDPDELPKVPDPDECGTVRGVSSFSLRVIEPDGSAQQLTGGFTFELVEFLANEHWLLTCCHPTECYGGTDCGPSSEPEGLDRFLPAVERHWRRGDFATAGDLGVLWLYQLACSYRDARPALVAWLEHWELDFFKTQVAKQDPLIALRGLASQLRRRLDALNAHHEEAGEAWFAHVSDDVYARRADDYIGRTLRWLTEFGGMVRSGFELLHAYTTAQQLEIAHETQKSSEESKDRFEMATATFLVPTLIAGLWGENTWVPGEKHVWGFVLTVVVMIGGTLIARRILKAIQTNRGARAT